MTLDPTSLLIGAIIGAVAGFLIKLSALRSLNLKIEKLGIALGVEGFAPPPPPAPAHSLQTGNISNMAGDLVAGNQHKNISHGDSVSNSNSNSNQYGPTNTLNQYINGIGRSVAELSALLDVGAMGDGFEHRSELITYRFGGARQDGPLAEIRDIERQLEPMTSGGWVVANVAVLPDYQGTTRLWVQLIRPRRRLAKVERVNQLTSGPG